MAGPWCETDPGFCELTAAMRDLITAGGLLVQEGINVPTSLRLPTEPDSTGCATVNGTRSAFEKTIHEEGWTLFFRAGEIKTTVFGFDRQHALRAALDRLIVVVKSQHCNSIEITRVTDKSFLKVPYVSVSAHARHLQKASSFRAPIRRSLHSVI